MSILVICFGGIDKIIETSKEERAILSGIEALDFKVQSMRQMLREGKTLEGFEF